MKTSAHLRLLEISDPHQGWIVHKLSSLALGEPKEHSARHSVGRLLPTGRWPYRAEAGFHVVFLRRPLLRITSFFRRNVDHVFAIAGELDIILLLIDGP